MFGRRGLLAAAVGGAAGVLFVPARRPARVSRPVAAPPVNPADWTSVRAQFALPDDVANLSAFYFASHPAGVRAAIERHRAGMDADPLGYVEANQSTQDDRVARAAAGYLRTDAGQIAFTDSTTMGLGLLYSGLRLAPGDEVLTTEHDHYATHESLRLRGLRDGVRVRRVRLYDASERATPQEMVARLAAALRPATRLVAITWVHSSTGVRVPVRQIADAVAAANASRPEAERILLSLDGVHGFGAEDATPDALGVDFLVTGTHKWLFGPRGTGLVWGRPQAWSRFTPVIPSFIDTTGAAPGPWSTPGGFHSFEHRWALAEAFDLHRTIGPRRVADRTHTLATALKDGLATIGSVRLRTPRAAVASAGLVCCEVEGYGPHEAAAKLRGAKVISSATPYDPSYLRFGPTIINSESDVDRALAAVRAL
ncbi:aminotransferase class V-fold PLP-dependent enzyme [Asanoa siamensis]|uniref:aminotransferase class V-fold PLP-dependent enzyme n=1 Tax=Asanoa siamensis TaxID=926357 RepID=UPI001EF2BFA7|nr:aminotransferase class V-fold PLP-dependent enzyme [Asanoa siamensis]